MEKELMTEDQRRKLVDWRNQLQRIYRAHYLSSTILLSRHHRLGMIAVVCSAVVGTSVFASLGSNPDQYLQIGVGMISVAGAILASLQTFLRNSEQSQQHKSVGASFASLHRRVDLYLASPPDKSCNVTIWMEQLRADWDLLSKEAPTAIPSAWGAATLRSQRTEAVAQQS